jgi:hypothetical protein
MSLISLRNFSAPLRSKVQIGILVTLALVVAAIRFGASAGSVVPSDSSRGVREEPVVDPRDAELVEFLKGVNKGRDAEAKRAAGAGDDELQGLMDGSFERDLQRKQNQGQNSGKFNDIRKSLGLE